EEYAKLKFVGPDKATSRPHGIEKYVPVTTSTVVGSPDPPPPYRVARTFPKIKINFPIAVRRQPGSDRLIVIDQPWSYGPTGFGHDGMMYVTSGDGTSDSDTNLAGQDMTKLLSKVLRIDVDHPDPGKTYSVPKDNPFVGVKGIVPETWAYGLRNPWRLTVDEKTGHIWVGQNGQD